MNFIRNNIFGRNISVLFYYFLLLTSYFLLSTCSSTTETDEGVTFSGTITLEGETDHSGVKVSLYKPVELDTALVRINQEYPNIGVQISQETEFDHREHVPLYTTMSGADGSWQIDGIKPEVYNAVAEKSGFGWQYVNEYGINSNKTQSFLLKEVRYYENTIISENTTWFEGDLITIEGTLVIPNNIIVSIEQNVFILLNENAKIECEGNMDFADTGGWIKILQNEAGKWAEIKVSSNSFKLNNTILKGSKKGINYEESNLFVENCIFKYNDNGIFLNKSSNRVNTVHNSLFCSNEEGIWLFACDSVLVNENVFILNSVGMDGKGQTQVMIKNNLFNENEIALKLFGGCTFEVKNNEFTQNPYALKLVDRSTAIVEFNSFQSSTQAINLYRYQSRFRNNLMASNNNFLYNEWHIYNYDYLSSNYTYQCTGNYWGENIVFNIRLKIYDSDDNPAVGTIVIEPIEQNPIINAGINL